MIVMRALVAVITLALLWPVVPVDPAAAQPVRASVQAVRVAGRVEILRTGQTQWAPAVAGVRLIEGEEIRAFSSASADLAFPDGSTVVLVENSRLLMSRLEFDQQKRSRLVLLHLAVGKLRAAIAQTAITLARARQSNFAITTPTAVAAARGTIVWVGYDGKTMIAVEPEPGRRIEPEVECITLASTGRTRQLVGAGLATTDCTPPVLTPSQFLTLANPGTVDLGAPVTAPSTASILAIIGGTDPGTSPIVGPVGPPPVGLPGPPTVGQNPPVSPPKVCASPPCN